MGEVLLGWGGRTILRSGYRGVVTPWEGGDVRGACRVALQRAPSARGAVRAADGKWAIRRGLALQGQPFESHPAGRAGALLSPPKNKRLPMGAFCFLILAERVGFEPTVRSPVRLISSQVHSTTLPPLLVTIIMRSFRVRPHYRRRVRESQGLSAAAVHFAGRPAITASNVCRSRIRFVLRSKMPSVTPTSQ